MCWINLAATRGETREEAEVLLDDWENTTELSLFPMRPILLAFLSGETSYIERAKKLSHRLLKFFDDSESLLSPEQLPDVLGLSVAAHIDGAKQHRLWKKIAAARKPKDARTRALQSIVARLLEGPSKSDRQPEPVRGHVHNEAQWIKLVAKAPVHHLFDLAATPDHPLWLSCLEAFVLPLGLLYQRELEAAGNTDVSVFDLFRMGAYPWKHPNILYERRQERPDSLSKPDPTNPETWFGFDAIDVIDNEIRAYHWLGFTWKAPLLFEDKVNAYHFLDTVDLSWRLVEQAMPKEKWRNLNKRLKKGECVHVVVHDEAVSPAVNPDLDDAAKHYHLRIDVDDPTTA